MLRKITRPITETIADPDIDNYKVSGSLSLAMGVAAYLANSSCNGVVAAVLAGMSIATMGWSVNQLAFGTRNSSRFYQPKEPVIEPQATPDVELKNVIVNSP